MDINKVKNSKSIKIMRTKHLLKKMVFALFVLVTIAGCKGYDEDLIYELDVNRAFAPVALKAIVRNQTTVELNWTANEDVDHYVVEFSADDFNFTTIFTALNVTADQLPIQVPLEGETVYYIRVKAVSAIGLDDSTWAITSATTLTEQLMLAFQPGDVEATKVTLRWVAGINVTHILIQPGNMTHNITPQEKLDGMALIEGLTGETEYFVTLYNNNKVRGTTTFTTGIDVGDNTLVLPTDNLFQMITDAAPGDILLLEQGDYTAQTGTITLNKPITIQGLRVDFKPVLNVNFLIVDGATDVNLIDLELKGNAPTLFTDVVRFNTAGSYNSLLVKGCVIHDYDRSLIGGNVSGATVNNVTVEDCIVTNVVTNGGDFIDFRTTNALNITVKTSTFKNCAPARDFFRVDAAGALNGTGQTVNVLLEECTLYGVCNNTNRITYVRFNANDITIRRNIFAQTTGYYSNQSSTDASITFENNNYFNAPGFYNAANLRYDITTNYTTLDPEFTNVTEGNFHISNQSLIDNQIGDPRWR